MVVVALLSAAQAWAVSPGDVRWTDMATDTLRINALVQEVRAEVSSSNPQDYVMAVATRFIDTPYAAGTLEGGDVEQLTVCLDSLDCTTYVETVMALAMTAARGKGSWRDFINNLERLRYRGGVVNGYPSRLHYVSDWIVDNSSRGNIIEATTRMPSVDYQVKTLDYMTTHRDAYPALADEANYQGIKNRQEGFRSHRYPYIKKGRIERTPTATSKALRPGDILAFTTNIAGLDVAHFGIYTEVDGVPSLLHAGSRNGRVMVDALPLADYLKRAKHLTGFRVIRLIP